MLAPWLSAAAARGYPDCDACNRRCRQCPSHHDLRAALGASMGDRRWRIEHARSSIRRTCPRIAPAGIIASMQPTHQTSDRLMAEKRLGPNRLAGAYAWQSVLKNGAKLAFGSDFRLNRRTLSPALQRRSAVRTSNGQPPGGWIPVGTADASPRRFMPSRAGPPTRASRRRRSARWSRANGPTSSCRPRSDQGRCASRSRERRCWRPGSPGRKSGSSA